MPAPNINLNQIQNATPDNLKAKGAAKLPLLLSDIGAQIPTIINPSLENLIQKYIPNDNTCISESSIKELIQQRDEIVQQLNNIGIKINQVGSSITGISDFLNTIIPILTTIDTTLISLSTAAKLIPSPPGVPGIIPSALNDAQTFIRKTTFDKYGNSKLAKLQGIMSSSALVISIIGGYVLRAVILLDQIDQYIKSCYPYSTIIPPSPEIKSLANSQTQAEQTINETTYNGFILEIEEVPYTPTVIRRRALGKNQYGIVLIQTELSFTTNNQTLIDELKLIIDKNNLKAY